MRRHRAGTLEALALAPHPSNHYVQTLLHSFPDGQEGKWDPPSVAERLGKRWLFCPQCVLGQGGQYSSNHTLVSFLISVFCDHTNLPVGLHPYMYRLLNTYYVSWGLSS